MRNHPGLYRWARCNRWPFGFEDGERGQVPKNAAASRSWKGEEHILPGTSKRNSPTNTWI